MNDKMQNWKKIWGGKIADPAKLSNNCLEDLFMELKRLTGNDTVGNGGVSYEAFLKQYQMVKKEMAFSTKSEDTPNSFFEVGCGSGALLLLLQNDLKKQFDVYSVGGMDYSESLIEAAKLVLDNPTEIYCSEASELATNIKYDCVFSYSAFEYFYDYEYAKTVLDKMIEKANRSVAVLDVHDINKKSEYNEYRRSIIPNYDEKYADLQKLFYDKSFFVSYAENNNLDLKITSCRLDGYWNAPFTYDVYLYK